MKLDSSRRTTHQILISVIALLSIAEIASLAAREPARRDVESLQLLVNALKQQLKIASAVELEIVDRNPLLVSVEPRKRDGAFALLFDREFLETLDDTDIRAAIAHELGHVWIFTHHPYLQTERLANDVAMRAVSRDSLLKVYEKVWARAGTKVDPATFVGQ